MWNVFLIEQAKLKAALNALEPFYDIVSILPQTGLQILVVVKHTGSPDVPPDDELKNRWG